MVYIFIQVTNGSLTHEIIDIYSKQCYGGIRGMVFDFEQLNQIMVQNKTKQ